jgi:hypothetical protein
MSCPENENVVAAVAAAHAETTETRFVGRKNLS